MIKTDNCKVRYPFYETHTHTHAPVPILSIKVILLLDLLQQNFSKTQVGREKHEKMELVLK